MSQTPNWEHLRAFLSVARAGTLSGAAVALGVKHSTVSRHVTALEEATRARLFERTPSGLALTPAGERLLEAAEAVENQIHLAQEEIGGRDLSAGGSVRIGAPDGVGAFFLAPRLPALTERYPNLTLQLVAMPRVFNLTKREADLAIVLSLPEQGRLATRKLTDYALGVFASRAYLDAAPPIRVPADLRRHRFIDYIDDLIFTTELDYLDEAARGARASLQSSNIIAQMNAARGGGGLVVLPRFLAAQFPDLAPVLKNSVRLKRSWWLVVHESQRDIARVRIVMDYIADQFWQARELFQ
ncbi:MULTISPECIES: LysR family transcriptional regulator [Methylopila]|nr:LysR family transcriptional regulator [Methylopila turkensis]